MKSSYISAFLVTVTLVIAGMHTGRAQTKAEHARPADTLHYPEETHFRNLRQLTFGGDNAEAYFSYDGRYLIFQRTNAKEGLPCDQIFIGKVPQTAAEPFQPRMVSTGKGRTTCPYFLPDGKHIIYASTHLGGDSCPPVPDRSKYGNRYIWPLYDSYDIFLADTSGRIIKQLTNAKGYDAEATLSPDGKTMIYTSDKDGDLDLYAMDLATGKEKKLTNTLGYDGGAWFSRDGKKIIWRASRPQTPEEVTEYKELLAAHLVAPTRMEVFTANADGSNVQQVTRLGNANWAPVFMPDSRRILFASNHEYKRGFPFNLYTINPDGSGLQKISRDKGFDAFAMFSYDGKKLVFCSNRNNGGTRDTNIFVADWTE
ncbi:TolB family protein [Flavihumibacter petaseus]|uniref:Tol system protein TolB n=1 Tax=Flavihumibacter petaseus NBRC 106054 TaxID=1220578 RepID=A0A0E9N0Y7_9BACT|nr:PD40 domain-containing protein [Flavihumibacter petaseus]GAO43499.1 Tol system protein TolB [Flavihumibacter petaseus NBRC 106054]